MIQRIQTIYLLIVVLISVFAPFYIPLWDNTAEKAVFATDQTYVLYGFLCIAALAFVTIFLFKNRKLQIGLVRFDIILNFVLLGFFVYWSLMLPGEKDISEKGIGMLVPIISIVFLVLANKAIKKDEDLVKSVDRLR